MPFALTIIGFRPGAFDRIITQILFVSHVFRCRCVSQTRPAKADNIYRSFVDLCSWDK